MNRAAQSVEAPEAETSRNGSEESGFWDRLKKHKVLQWSVTYLGAALALAHGEELVGSAFQWPEIVQRITIAAFIAGFPLAVALAWFHGHRGMTRVNLREATVVSILVVVGAVLILLLARPSRVDTTGGAAVAHYGSETGKERTTFDPPPRSVAVLPFVNMSGDPKQDYFSDGLSEELLDALSQIPSLQVAARTSAFLFKGQNADIPTIGRRLNVAAVLEGSVRRYQNTVRVTAQLISTKSGYHLWSHSYSSHLKDILAVQSDVATQVAAQLQLKLLPEQLENVGVGATRNPDAQDAYLRGVHLYNDVQTRGAYRAAADAFEEATTLDPSFSRAWAWKARALLAVAQDAVTPPVALLTRAEEAAQKAVALAPQLGDAYAARGRVYTAQFAFRAALDDFSRAVELSPGSATVLQARANFARLMGDDQSALKYARNAITLDPESYWPRQIYINALVRTRQFTQALQEIRAASNTPHSIAAHVEVDMGLLHLAMDQPQRAAAECGSGLMQTPAGSINADLLHYCLAMAYHRLDQRHDAEREFARFRKSTRDSMPFRNAEVYAEWGDRQAALKWLSVAEKAHDQELAGIRDSIWLEPVRREPEYVSLVRRLNFPP